MGSLSKSFSWSLIAKFSQGYNKKDPKLGRPSMEDLHKYFVAMDFKQPFSLGLLDNRHAIIHFHSEEDYMRLYSRSVWYIGAVTMHIFKWTPYFRVDKESSVVPIWITFQIWFLWRHGFVLNLLQQSDQFCHFHVSHVVSSSHFI